jgi:hypothetical protein
MVKASGLVYTAMKARRCGQIPYLYTSESQSEEKKMLRLRHLEVSLFEDASQLSNLTS